ncbi:MAG TPA: lipopolysaccharide heptosyltransferase II [Verrucomicrobiae bacterium]|nr:lipopolysaccharide heptosyltransferase II [Verrucomicrobiae bacterium]
MAVSFQQPPERILVRGVNWLGDAVMTTPALIRLREKFPDARITLLTPEKLRDLYLHHPAVNETIGVAVGEGLLTVSDKLRSGNFDLAVLFPNSPRSALEVYFAGIPRRVGYARPWRNLFLTHQVPSRSGHVPMRKRTPGEIRRLIVQPRASVSQNLPATAHHVHEYLHLVSALGANPEPVPPALYMPPNEVLRTAWSLPQSAATDYLIGLNPGAEYGPAKRWPLERFAQVANELYGKISCQFLIFGGTGDVSLAEQLVTLLPIPAGKGHVVSLAGKTSLRDLMAGLKLCDVLLTNDTGPMHLAAALGTPVVVPFGSTSPELTGPGLPGDPQHRLLKSNAVCSPCFLRECPIDFRCMKGITVERVVSAVIQATAGGE